MFDRWNRTVQGSRGDSLETLRRVETLCVKAVRVERNIIKEQEKNCTNVQNR